MYTYPVITLTEGIQRLIYYPYPILSGFESLIVILTTLVEAGDASSRMAVADGVVPIQHTPGLN